MSHFSSAVKEFLSWIIYQGMPFPALQSHILCVSKSNYPLNFSFQSMKIEKLSFKTYQTFLRLSIVCELLLTQLINIYAFRYSTVNIIKWFFCMWPYVQLALTQTLVCALFWGKSIYFVSSLLRCNDMENEKGPYFTWVDSVDPKLVF